MSTTSNDIEYFSDKLKDTTDWNVIRRRLNKKPRPPRRLKTGLSIDEYINGLPYGLIVLYGNPGTGKSRMAKAIANAVAENKKIIHFYGDDSFDAPKLSPDRPNINTVDMIAWKPDPPNATKYILKFCQMLQPELIVLDSLTTIFGATTKAVPEADIREWTLVLANHLAGKCACVAISEVRGSGFSEQPAGGKGVIFPAIMIVKFKRKEISASWDKEQYDEEIGSVVWTMIVEKDREGKSRMNKEFIVDYIGEEPILTI